jgi:hypothetical protein
MNSSSVYFSSGPQCVCEQFMSSDFSGRPNFAFTSFATASRN